MTHTGKIGRLPTELRELVNHRLEAGEPGTTPEGRVPISCRERLDARTNLVGQTCRFACIALPIDKKIPGDATTPPCLVRVSSRALSCYLPELRLFSPQQKL